jgi:hypothetical protein
MDRKVNAAIKLIPYIKQPFKKELLKEASRVKLSFQD